MKTEKSIFYYLLGMFIDENGKPSMSRWLLAIWMWIGWLMIHHELRLQQSIPSLQNTVWTAWTYASGFLAAAVFGPRVMSYFSAGAAGATTSIAAAIRDQVVPALAKMDAKVSEMNAAPAAAATQVNVNAPAAPVAAGPAETPVPTAGESGQ
jgi:hypothetical protein